VPTAAPLPDAEVVFDNVSSPWHTVAEIRSVDRPALLHDVAAVFDAAGASVLAASLTAGDDLVVDRFELTDRDGAKLGPAHEAAIRRLKISKLLAGYRGKPGADMAALVKSIMAIAAFAEAHRDTLLELDVNPLMVRPDGAVAVDALVVLGQ